MKTQVLRRPALEARLIARHSAEVVVVHEVQHLLRLLDADKVVGEVLHTAKGVAVFLVLVEVGMDPAGSDDEDVAILEFDALGFGAVFDFLKGDGTGRERVV